MNRHTKQIIAVAILTTIFVVSTLFRYVEPAKSPGSQPAAVFNRPVVTLNVGRTLRPDGQTEDADLNTDIIFGAELGDLCPELWSAPFSVDALYISPTEQTARLILKRAFRKLENVYVPEAYDCDDNAQEMMVLLRKEALVEYREYPAALAIGFVGVRIDGPVDGLRMGGLDPSDYPLYHAMVVMRLKGGRWLLIEPLTHQFCEFTGPIFEGSITVHLLYF